MGTFGTETAKDATFTTIVIVTLDSKPTQTPFKKRT